MTTSACTSKDNTEYSSSSSNKLDESCCHCERSSSSSCNESLSSMQDIDDESSSTCTRSFDSVGQCDDDSSDDGMEEEEDDENDDECIRSVKRWTIAIPIGLGLCPWAMKSQTLRRISYQTCLAFSPQDVAVRVCAEARALCCHPTANNAKLRTTLLICPNVESWNKDFAVFDEFVKNFGKKKSKLRSTYQDEKPDKDNEADCESVLEHITLVAFHPEFLKWHGPAEGITVGSVVWSHRAMRGGMFQKSLEIFPATIVETNSRMFGQRRVKVEFHNDDDKCTSRTQYVPTDWCVPMNGQNDDGLDDSVTMLGPPLPDNVMHRAPYPTIHLIRNADLAKLPARNVSRVKRMNAQRMMKLGWQGVSSLTEKEKQCKWH